MIYYIRDVHYKLILKSGCLKDMEKYFKDVYHVSPSNFEIISEQQLKEESWEF